MLKPKILDIRPESDYMEEFRQPDHLPAMVIIEIIGAVEDDVWTDDISLYVTHDTASMAIIVITFRSRSCDISVMGNSVRMSGSLCGLKSVEFDLSSPDTIQEVADFLAEAILSHKEVK